MIGVTEVSDGDTSLFVVITGDFSMIKMDVMPGSFMVWKTGMTEFDAMTGG